MTDSDYFELLGLSRRWQVDRNLLERNYLERSREAHPDAFVSKGAAAQRAALELSSRINAAYRVVRDPILRAEYLVDARSVTKVKGVPFTAGELEQAILEVLR